MHIVSVCDSPRLQINYWYIEFDVNKLAIIKPLMLESGHDVLIVLFSDTFHEYIRLHFL